MGFTEGFHCLSVCVDLWVVESLVGGDNLGVEPPRGHFEWCIHLGDLGDGPASIVDEEGGTRLDRSGWFTSLSLENI